MRAKSGQCQAERVIGKFGGARQLSAILGAIGRPREKTTIYKWTYPRKRGGTGGVIPSCAWDDITAAARHKKITITAEDADPRRVLVERVK